MKQSEEKPAEKVKEPKLIVPIPVHISRWLIYSALFYLPLAPLLDNGRQIVCAGLILGHFASQLNALINKK